jgi:uncharacterized membrane protein
LGGTVQGYPDVGMTGEATSSSSWWADRLPLVRVRQVIDDVRHRLSFVPILYVGAAVVLVHVVLWIDSLLLDRSPPLWVTTTVESARAVFSAMAGGLITSITLLLSMTFVAMQLASTQFSPRTLRDWLGNRTLQNAVGLVLGTTVFCLLALRSTRDLGDDATAIVPHMTVLVAVGLGVLSLVAVVRAVDHLSHSVQVEAVAERVSNETIGVIRELATQPEGQAPDVVPASGAHRGQDALGVPDGATAVEASRAGWVQQVDQEAIFEALPEGSTAYVVASIGGYVTESSPLAWVESPTGATDGEETANDHPRSRNEEISSIARAFAIGESRTMQQDIEFGIVQLTDIAVRALSPGVNDPTTAAEMIVHLGNVMTALWEQPAPSTTHRRDGRTVVRHRPHHGEYLRRAFEPIALHGATDAHVLRVLLHTLEELRSEVVRRRLSGPLGPIDAAIADVREAWEDVQSTTWR